MPYYQCCCCGRQHSTDAHISNFLQVINLVNRLLSKCVSNRELNLILIIYQFAFGWFYHKSVSVTSIYSKISLRAFSDKTIPHCYLVELVSTLRCELLTAMQAPSDGILSVTTAFNFQLIIFLAFPLLQMPLSVLSYLANHTLCTKTYKYLQLKVQNSSNCCKNLPFTT